MYRSIPDELKGLDQWCVFRIQERNGRSTKVPINAETGEFAKSNDESTWSSFDAALDAISQFNCNGLGFFLQRTILWN